MFVLYAKKTQKTGKAIARTLQIDSGMRAPAKRPNVLIRWGSSIEIPYTPKKEINSQAAVLLATDKLRSLQELQKNKVSVPPIFLFNEVEKPKNLAHFVSGFPILARTRTHQRGTDILLCMQISDIHRAVRMGRQYGLQYIPTAREYRVHIFRNTSIKASQKIWTDTSKPYKPWIRNHLNGHTFRKPEIALDDNSRDLAKAAVKALGLDFGAVDLIIDDTGKSFVLEVNTGPGLVKSGIIKYCKHLAKKLGIKSLNEDFLESLTDVDDE